jgi:hypothetical protein
MAHELEIRDGQACMMYAGETPWHKLGTKVEKEVTSATSTRMWPGPSGRRTAR